MVNYTCQICLKEFSRKNDLTYHMEKKKKPCQPNIPKNSEIFLSIPKYSENPDNLSLQDNLFKHDFQETNDDSSESGKKQNNISCDYCNKIFSTKFNLNKHIKFNCKIKKEEENKKKENDILTKRVASLEKEIEELKKKPQNISNVVINNSNNNKTLSVGNKSVNIVAHGQEDLSTIDLETKLEFLNTLDFSSIIPNMAKHLFINDDKPEFKNFRVTDMSRNKSEYHDGKKWNTGKADQGVLKIFENINDVLIEPFTDDNLEKTIKFIQKDPKKYSKQTITWSKTYCRNLYDTKDKENISNKNDILDELKLIFYNNREQILNIGNDCESNVKKVTNDPCSTTNSNTPNTNNIKMIDDISLSSDDEYIPTLVEPRYVEQKRVKK
jgi:hypothetical protein